MSVSVEDPIILQWVEDTLNGNQDAFAELVNTYQNAVYNLCYRMLGERTESEDATQEAFLRAYLNMDRYDPARSFKTWVLSIASNHCIDRLRKRRLTRAVALDCLVEAQQAGRAVALEHRNCIIDRAGGVDISPVQADSHRVGAAQAVNAVCVVGVGGGVGQAPIGRVAVKRDKRAAALCRRPARARFEGQDRRGAARPRRQHARRAHRPAHGRRGVGRGDGVAHRA